MSAAADIEKLQAKLGDKVAALPVFREEHGVRISLADLRAVFETCAEELDYPLLLDLSSIDHLGEEPRFELVYELASLDDSRHLRVKASISEDEEAPTISDLWATANWHEREVYDMMGIKFSGHPDLTRILMWEGYPYFPLRKDFPLAGRVTDMPDVAFSGVAPLEGGPFVTAPGTDRVTGEPRARGES